MLYTFYGDDFTGSTDVLEQLALAGVSSVLFTAPPAEEQLARFPGVSAIGVAGDSRSRTPEWMSGHLPAIFAALRAFGAPVTHFKTCSTFDSSPSIGSIGRALELGIEVFGPGVVPVVVGAPHLRRFVVFGQLFAAAPDGEVVRIDRHPMAQHPVTPMREADLRLHLAQQTTLAIGLIDLTELAGAALDRQGQVWQAMIVDTVDETTLEAAGELVWRAAIERRQLFAAGSSGLTAALIAAWRRRGLIAEAPPRVQPTEVEAVLVLSGSCSPVTQRQIVWAADHGFQAVGIDVASLLDPRTGTQCRQQLRDRAVGCLEAGRSPLLYTALGAPDEPAHGDRLGAALGLLLRDILAVRSVPRVLLCGGDTSSHALHQLGLTALTWLASLQTGAPLCRAHRAADQPALELVLKGGQVGTEDFFEVVRRGRQVSSTERVQSTCENSAAASSTETATPRSGRL